MNQKIKSSLIAWGVTILIFLILVSIGIGTKREVTNRIDYCQENGYEGYKDMSGFLESTKYKCYKKVPTGVGYEYKYSGYID